MTRNSLAKERLMKCLAVAMLRDGENKERYSRISVPENWNTARQTFAFYKEQSKTILKTEYVLMRELEPKCDPEGVYSVKRTCVELGICHKTFLKYRAKGLIKPLNPGNSRRPVFSGKSIIECWKKLTTI